MRNSSEEASNIETPEFTAETSEMHFGWDFDNDNVAKITIFDAVFVITLIHKCLSNYALVYFILQECGFRRNVCFAIDYYRVSQNKCDTYFPLYLRL